MTYLWQLKQWPAVRWDSEALLPLISRARLAQGKLLTKVGGIPGTV